MKPDHRVCARGLLVAASFSAVVVALEVSAGPGAWTTNGPRGAYAYTIALDPATPSTVYVTVDALGVLKSTDAGATWALVSRDHRLWFVHELAVDPSNPSTLYAGSFTAGVLKSTDAGSSWLPAN